MGPGDFTSHSNTPRAAGAWEPRSPAPADMKTGDNGGGKIEENSLDIYGEGLDGSRCPPSSRRSHGAGSRDLLGSEGNI